MTRAMPESGFATSFIGAFQASLSVLLNIAYGSLIAHLGLFSSPDHTSKDISKICVFVFLPALLFCNLGSQLSTDNIKNYLVVFAWCIVTNAISIFVGLGTTRLSLHRFEIPVWFTPAITFNNTTSLPLLLLQSLETAGILDTLIRDNLGETSADVIDRSRSYFLINAMVSNSLTFGIGPKILANAAASRHQRYPVRIEDTDSHSRERIRASGSSVTYSEEDAPLLHIPQQEHHPVSSSPSTSASPVTRSISWVSQFISPPLVGAVLGVLAGLISPIHRAFFSSPSTGGFLNTWLTTSLKNVGSLFASLQIIVVGVKLYQSFSNMIKGKPSGRLPFLPTLFVLCFRYLFWPLVSVLFVRWLSQYLTSLDDPIMWFCMILMPVGPPAMKLTALADVSGDGVVLQEEKMGIAKLLSISYVFSPLMSLAVVGSLKVSETIMKSS